MLPLGHIANYRIDPKRHQRNESKWFIKLDFTNFFGSTTLEFVLAMLSLIFPFSEMVKRRDGRDELSKALSLCFLNGGLPQGAPISPFLTNVMMIPLDHRFSNALRNFEKNRFVYTRYADDLLISCQHDFDKDKMQQFVIGTLAEFHAPFSIKPEKMRYGSSAGRNWNLELMLNKENQITIGHKKKKHFKAMLDGYVRAKKSGGDYGAPPLQDPWMQWVICRLQKCSIPYLPLQMSGLCKQPRQRPCQPCRHLDELNPKCSFYSAHSGSASYKLAYFREP